ncbi:hypothetical protein EVG20_g211 [Dentipellis fragilis]|uniref:CBF1-interacting co-repressor CIR N-terminal domain-containing protein n=1 Tax=Dentipellis fragilis TaxID=205917 RepID=A0A4Y9ZG44_9AGAM|nr:hypothetical protein EVG20_g211 [Dentipellis fragilis]
MGGGDLNMKKSWHPLLLKNQERVWLEEKKALEEKKKLDQLRKEKEEERQLQELQRLQEEQTGKKRAEKLEWMYTTPATGSSQNANELEDYLLGKKRVDKILIANEHEKVGAAHKNFIAIQNANSIRDTTAKIREDPLFAIKQQEAAAYEALMSNPLRLREMQERNGIKPKKEKKKEKKEKHRKERDDRFASPRRDYDRDRDHRSRRSVSPRDHRSRSSYRSRHDVKDRRFDDRRYDDRHPSRRPRSRDRSADSYHRRSYRSRSPDRKAVSPRDSRRPPWPRSDESESPDEYTRGRGPAPREEIRDRHDRYNDDRYKRPRSRSPTERDSSSYPKRARMSPPPPPRSAAPSTSAADDRAARLAAMSSNASSLSSNRKERLTALLEKEKAELEAEEQLRAKSKGMGGFLSHEQKKVFGGQGGLEDRLRRGRAGLVAEGD